jgi:uncharacterized spore protein YtfJ
MTTLEEIMQGTRDTYTVSRVFGEPVEKEGVTVIPVATVAGGGGGGSGAMPAQDIAGELVEGTMGAEEGEGVPTGTGGGFGGMARPAGVYMIRGDQVEWQPAIDVNRIALVSVVASAIVAVVLGLMFSRR